MSIEQIRDILLEHKGKRNAIKSKEIAQQINIDRGPSNVKIRKLITETLKSFKLPIAGNPGLGYYLIETSEELRGYLNSLDSRIKNITDRKTKVALFYSKYYPEEELELTGEIFDDDFEEEGNTLEI